MCLHALRCVPALSWLSREPPCVRDGGEEICGSVCTSLTRRVCVSPVLWRRGQGDGDLGARPVRGQEPPEQHPA